MKTNKLIFFLLVALAGVSCSDEFFNVPVTSTATAEAVKEELEDDPASILSLVNAAYTTMVQLGLYSGSHDVFGYMSILHATDMMSGDIAMYRLDWFANDYLHLNRNWTQSRTNMIWGYFYTIITIANKVLSLTSASSESPDIRAARGQALALRAFSYLYLVQLYQHVYPVVATGGKDQPGVPLYYASNEEKKSITGRASVKTILAQIEEDLTTAIKNLKDWQRTSKNQIDYNVANGLLARYCLLTQKWDEAIAAAKEARKTYSIMPAAEIHTGFMDIDNAEWMWGFDHNAKTSTLYGSFFSHISNLTAGYAGLGYAPRLIDRELYNRILGTDERKKWFQSDPAKVLPKTTPAADATFWKLPYANLKFGYDGAFTQDYVYMRAAEMVLIEAEALASKNNLTGAATVLNELLSKRGTNLTKTSVYVKDIWEQRRIELWGEGFAMFDLKRQNKGIDRNYPESNHYSSAKIPVPAQDKRWIYQIPRSEILENPSITEADNNE
ncbi:MAG: RagB/SusD family nutrient uptake outer membrane protein [Prevotellaceae bacterium]|nr:RagB/SusD family nutrient uptake outer membrane protein [Prevotellaceae bacterium]